MWYGEGKVVGLCGIPNEFNEILIRKCTSMLINTLKI